MPSKPSAADKARAFYATQPALASAADYRDAFAAMHPETEKNTLHAIYMAFDRMMKGRRGAEDVVGIGIDAEQEEPWRVENDHYVWETGSGKHFRLSVALIDELFYNFSKHGLNLTQTQVLNKFNLETWQWNSLKSRLGLVKLSNVFSPHTEAITPKADLASMMEGKMDARFQNRGVIIEQAYQNSTAKEYLRVIADAERNTFLNQKVLAELADRFPEAKARWVLRGPTAPTAPEHLVTAIADVHMGANVKKLSLTPDYNKQQIYAYADQVIAKTNAVGAKNVWLLFAGDAIETFSGLNHADSWKSIELHGAAVLAAAYEFFEYLLSRIQNIAGVLAVGGNHDRAAASNKDESTAQIAESIFYFLKKSYGNQIEVTYESEVVAKHIGGIRYIMTHGGKGNTGNESKVKDLFYDYGDASCFTVLLTAHLHSRMIKLDSHNKRHLVLPPLFTGNAYSENLGFTSTAGLLHINNDGYGYPRVVDETLAPLSKRATVENLVA